MPARRDVSINCAIIEKLSLDGMLLRRRGFGSGSTFQPSSGRDTLRTWLSAKCSPVQRPDRPDSALRAVRLTEPPGCWLLKTGRRLALRLITSEPLRSAAAALDISYETAGRTSKRCLKKPGPAARPSSSSSSSALRSWPLLPVANGARHAGTPYVLPK